MDSEQQLLECNTRHDSVQYLGGLDMNKNNIECGPEFENNEVGDSSKSISEFDSFKDQFQSDELLAEPKKKRNVWEDLQGDKLNVLLLLFLYTLQGLPIGLSEAIPLLLSNRNVAYEEQAKFNFVYYPFSMKLIWAPIVDSCFFARFGRRKSWLIPAQCVIGVTMLIASQYVDRLVGKEATETEIGIPPDVTSLTIMFFFLNLMAATQDVAVDGWALTMLKQGNVGYASTCNTLGQTTGWVLGYIMYTNMESAGLITLPQFLIALGVIFLVTTTLLAIFKSDKPGQGEESCLGLVDTYKILWKIIRHPLMPVVMLFLLTYKFGVASSESLTTLKLVEKGVPKSKVALLSIPMIPVKIIFTLLLSIFTSGPRPMTVWLFSYPLRLFFCLLLPLLVYLATVLITDSEQFPTYYYVILLAVFALRLSTDYAMQLSIMAFFARISDPAIGGTYMTFLNTLNNLGTMWPRSFALWFVAIITNKVCDTGAISTTLSYNHTVTFGAGDNVCAGTAEVDACEAESGTCRTITEGYYILSIVCCGVGYLWLLWGWRAIRQLQRVDPEQWRVVGRNRDQNKESAEKKSKFKYFYCF